MMDGSAGIDGDGEEEDGVGDGDGDERADSTNPKRMA
jgi:hypothetical protein